MKRKIFAMTAGLAAVALALTGCAGDSEGPAENAFPEGSTMAKIAAAGTITIGTKFDQPLFGLVGPDGTPVGFDVEVAKIIAKELGVEAKFVEAVSGNRETFIQNGVVDLVVATYTINDKRKESVSFAGPYYMAGQSILTLENNTTIKSDTDLVGQPVCSVTGSTPLAKLQEIGADAKGFGTYADCLEPLRNGQVVAISTDNVILAGFADQYKGEFKVVGTPFTDEPYGIGLGKDDTEFRTWINDVLEKAYTDGRYKAAWDSTAGAVLPYVAPPAPNRY